MPSGFTVPLTLQSTDASWAFCIVVPKRESHLQGCRIHAGLYLKVWSTHHSSFGWSGLLVICTHNTLFFSFFNRGPIVSWSAVPPRANSLYYKGRAHGMLAFHPTTTDTVPWNGQQLRKRMWCRHQCPIIDLVCLYSRLQSDTISQPPNSDSSKLAAGLEFAL